MRLYLSDWLSHSGLNTLFFDLCTAPFVLSLEEDWMYMDHTVAIQVRPCPRVLSVHEARIKLKLKGFQIWY